MTFLEFSTDRADYVLQLGSHNVANDWVPKGLDALIIENVGQSINLWQLHPQFGGPIRFCLERMIPVFGADADITGLGALRSVPSTFLIGPIELVYYYATKGKQTSNSPGRAYKLFSILDFIAQDPACEGRNALNAAKIEEYIVPKLCEISGKEKPRVGIIFGFGHPGIKEDLLSKRRRDFTLRNFQRYNFGFMAGFRLRNSYNKPAYFNAQMNC